MPPGSLLAFARIRNATLHWIVTTKGLAKGSTAMVVVDMEEQPDYI